MSTVKAHKWQVARGVSGWMQLGKSGPEAKCASHFVPEKGDTTACGRMPVRGKTPSDGITHYKLSWYPSLSARTVCASCVKNAPATVEQVELDEQVA